MSMRDRGLRWLYRGRRPHALARVLNRGGAVLAARGVGPDRLVVLEVEGRRSGRTIALPVVVAEHHGERYLVSMLGEDTNWVRNVRAAGGAAVLRHGRAEEVLLEEVPPADRAKILRRYVDLAPGARAHIGLNPRAPLCDFERIADRYPVFRITARSPSELAPAAR